MPSDGAAVFSVPVFVLTFALVFTSMRGAGSAISGLASTAGALSEGSIRKIASPSLI